jgi:hypothetical protein
LAADLAQDTIEAYNVTDATLDIPILGLTCLALGSWLTADDAGPTGPLLLALAERLSSRQDFPSLARRPHWEAAVALRGADAMDQARAAIVGETVSGCAELAIARIEELAQALRR